MAMSLDQMVVVLNKARRVDFAFNMATAALPK